MDYTERAKEMLRLRHDERMTLREIGEKFGLSRQRVHMIIGKTGGGFKQNKTEGVVLSMTDKTNKEVAEELGLSYGHVVRLRSGKPHPVVEGSTVGIHFKWTKFIQEKLVSLGHEVELMPARSALDMIVDGYILVNVSAAVTSYSTSQYLVNPQWRFRVVNSVEVDFVICVTGNEDVFIVPSSAISPTAQHICFCWPSARPSMGKFQRFQDQYDLLKGYY